MSRKHAAKNDTLPDDVHKPGIDCAFVLDVEGILQANIPLWLSTNGVVLCPEAIPPEYILRVTMLREPQHTIYTRPRVD